MSYKITLSKLISKCKYTLFSMQKKKIGCPLFFTPCWQYPGSKRNHVFPKQFNTLLMTLKKSEKLPNVRYIYREDNFEFNTVK